MKKICLWMVLAGLLPTMLYSQVDEKKQVKTPKIEGAKITNKEGSAYDFTVIADIEANEVPSQGRTGTCWSFSTLSFFESELLRMGKGKHNLSEMYIARKAYEDKAEYYVRMHGKNNFDEGGAFHDIPHVWRKYGILPEQVYTGLNYGTESHIHAEMAESLKGMVDALIKNPNRKLTPVWQDAIAGVLDEYLGEVPEKFEYQGKTFTPESYAESLELDMDNYVPLTSFTHHPFYETFVLEVPDNWAFGQVYNIPLDELWEVMEYSLKEGYSFAWASDVSEKGFSFRNGLAIVPKDEETIAVSGRDKKNFNDAGSEKKSNAFMEPVEEIKVTQDKRQEAFDNYQTTDDHGMHATGLVTDQNGTKYLIIKNSWGTGNDCDGYFYASEAYVRYKTIDILIHKDAIPKGIKKKLGL